MSHRLQVTLDDHQYEALVHERERTGASLAEIVRKAVDRTLGAEHPSTRAEAFRRGLRAAAGVWHDRDEDGVAYQRRVRAGLAERPRVASQ
jgi:hypothetical protein